MTAKSENKYDPAAIEKKWHKIWDEQRLFAPDHKTAKKPFYNLVMFPYPSGEGLHVGNCFAFIGGDIYGRYQLMNGYDVFEPMGFDAFGIHSENFAIKKKTHPMKLIPSNIKNFRRQLKQLGFMFDWDHEVQTIDPDYYRWTQWVFLQLHKAGLAYRDKAPVNWCPECQTVLSNEQVISGMCERHPETAVERRDTEQWFFRITDYAQRLLDNLEWIDWSDITKTAQRNWIGRSEGADIEFQLEGCDKRICVFTTRPDTLFGATYMVLAPEHPIVDELTAPAQREAVKRYREEASRKKEIDRLAAGQEKTGVSLGAHAINPITNKPIPIWISDYVLMDYGTGAIMAVPAHDQRDFEFATVFKLPIVQVIDGPDVKQPLEEAYTGDGKMINSAPYDGMDCREVMKKITADLEAKGLARSQVQYRLRDWCISRQRYWGPPIPMIHCEKCGIVPVPQEDLPVRLPEADNFMPDASGRPPLARFEEFYKTTCPKCGKEARRDTDVNDTFLDSAWYFLRYPNTGNDKVAWDPEITRKWLPVDMYIGGNEHAVLHLMYTRFIYMAFKDMGLVEGQEPFKKFRAHGLLIKEGNKMSKSRGNIVTPDDYVERYGADTLRMYLMFLGPFQEGGDFRDTGINGVRRFLERSYRFFAEHCERSKDNGVRMKNEGELAKPLLTKIHQTIRKVTQDIENLSYNTAIAAMMELFNELKAAEKINRWTLESFALMLTPFTPHLAEELWELLGHSETIHRATWPEYDQALATTDTVDIAIQINGKLRGTIQVARDTNREVVESACMEHEKVKQHIEGKTIRKVIYIPNKIVNIVAT
ncbi:MAG: leucine--tRNA ligase [Candidatus Eisenbacteria bacterium]|uniref:Leucine--tRNA ligase n=1 Tax=Eiseniibacteriota bacterium TaxID=2212470 RepID=A0A948RWD7_UNCEI|nr:leucine--tRNA ligase [Candidatus Eisenbacteria bacterium]MBU1948910.1 leucine--tRNA ligase [Candidatus Eisenbacteria bacterium]MBU2691716.1 leucine--tRNA ligase [Candidatus Eisenbacteria bacterium]